MTLFERANPVPDLDAATPHAAASIYLDTLQQRSATMTLVDTETPQRVDTRRWPFLAAAAAVAIVAGLVIVATRDGGDSVPADEPDAVVGQQPTPVSVGERFVTAIDGGDRLAAMSLLADDAPLQMLGATVPSEFEWLFGMFEATGDRFTLQGCEFTEPDQVECHALFSNRWTDAVAGERAEATFFIKVDGDQITAMRYALDTETFGPTVWEPFLEFVRQRSLDDFGKMFASHPDGMGVVGPILTDESLALHQKYTDEYAVANGDR